jgi:hypothetical protein
VTAWFHASVVMMACETHMPLMFSYF